MNVLAILLFAVAAAVQALPQYATLQRNLTPMVKTKPLVPGHPKAEKAAGRIVNGAPASLGQFPYQASVIMDYSYMCGGSLISASVVLTAGHCASGFSTWEVRLGLNSLSIIEPSRVTIVTRSATVHSEYNPNNLYNDIAVVFLGTNVPINTYIGLVNLPSRSQASNSFEGQTATVSGWGLNTDNGVIPDTLQYTTLNVMSNTQCSEYFGGPILDFTLCGVGSSGQSTCNGDSGGALVVGSQGSYTQIAVVSWISGNGCSSGDPAGFTRVTYFLDWISSTAGIAIP
ncbi:brachyurin-like isoform X4 [Schistocerca nitens]|uniref:brachyurin-like isoform X4 n=1 Tax=Schistocerca nitens TaxID=7011 RepID=UPI002117C99A|nr:brachyurin-like isoform X4 [Schistocerca nitens]